MIYSACLDATIIVIIIIIVLFCHITTLIVDINAISLKVFLMRCFVVNECYCTADFRELYKDCILNILLINLEL